MKFSKRENKDTVSVQTAGGLRCSHPFSELSSYYPFSQCEMKLYDSLKEAIPVIDAAIKKTVRLVGGFKVVCDNAYAERALDEFLKNVKVNGTGMGIDTFLSCFMEQLLTYGTAVGETVLSRERHTPQNIQYHRHKLGTCGKCSLCRDIQADGQLRQSPLTRTCSTDRVRVEQGYARQHSVGFYFRR